MEYLFMYLVLLKQLKEAGYKGRFAHRDDIDVRIDDCLDRIEGLLYSSDDEGEDDDETTPA